MGREPLENVDLLIGKDRVEINGNAVHESSAKVPPDGGVRAYAVMVGSFLTNGLLFGVINSYSVIYPVLTKILKDDQVSNAESRAALVGSLSMGTTFFLSPVSGMLTSLLGLRLTAVLGGVIATAGLVISSFLTHNVDALYFTYGIMYGAGASFAYTPSLAILGHYFKKHLGQVNGVVCVGSSVFTTFMPPLMDHMLTKYGLEWMFRVLALFTFGVALCGLLFKPLSVVKKPVGENGSPMSLLRTVINVEIWKIRKYRVWALSIPIALFGYFVPYVHIKTLVEESFRNDNVNFNLPLQCIAIASGVGRIIFGYLADTPGIDRILLQQISFYVIGALTVILPFASYFWLVVVISLGMGIFDGAFISVMGPISFELCGRDNAAQAIGCVLGLAALPLSIGPAVAGYIYTWRNKSYTLAFVLAGISPLVGATVMFAVRLGPRAHRQASANGHVMPLSDVEKSPAPLLTPNGNKKEQTAL